MFFDEILKNVIQVFALTWWILVPLGLLFVFFDLWMYYIRRKFILELKWVLLEIRIPPDIEKTPKAMEQVFVALRAAYSYGMLWKQKYIKGEVENWFTFEIVGYSGGVHFYVRTVKGNRHLVEAAIYAQYPDAEIIEAEDYLHALGKTLPNKTIDLWGADFVLAREDAYPIRTYPAFEEKTEEAQIDPIALITEVMSRCKNEEMIFLQLIITPTGDEWVKEGIKLRDKLFGRKEKEKTTFLGDIGVFFRNIIFAPFQMPEWPGEKKEDPLKSLFNLLTEGERNIIKAIETKIGKLGFKTTVRMLFIDDRATFSRAHLSAVSGAFHQFNTHDLNAFRPSKDTFTSVKKGFFKKHREYLRKRRMFDNYRRFKPISKSSVLNVEELATIFHFPTVIVEAPLLRRVATKKGEPPPGLPVE